MPDIKISDLSPEELRLEKKKVLERREYYFELYCTFKKKKQDAAVLASVDKKFLPPSEYRAIENKLKEYNDEVQKLQALSGEINSEIKKKESFIFERVFVDVCKEKLTEDKWNEIFNESKFRIIKGS